MRSRAQSLHPGEVYPNWNKLVNITLPRRGLVSSNRCTSSTVVYRVRTRRPCHPTAVVATDIAPVKRLIKTGKVADAARKSEYSGIFVPVELGELLVDGALVNRVPAKGMRARRRRGCGGCWFLRWVGEPEFADIIMRTIEILDRQSAKFRPVGRHNHQTGTAQHPLRSSTALQKSSLQLFCREAHLDEIKAAVYGRAFRPWYSCG